MLHIFIHCSAIPAAVTKNIKGKKRKANATTPDVNDRGEGFFKGQVHSF